MHSVAKALIEREKIDGDEFKALMNGETLPPLSLEPAEDISSDENDENDAPAQPAEE